MIARIGHRSAHSLGRRLLDAIRGRFVGGVGKSQSVYFVTVNGRRFKRVVFGDSYQAEQVEACLERVSRVAGFPRLVLRHENELWSEFVAGARPAPSRPADFDALARFYGAVLGCEPRQHALASTSWPMRLENDLWFLGEAGILDTSRVEALLQHGRSLQPERIWMGFDYVDPPLKNFVLADHGLVAIDLEALQDQQLLGTGIAKCRLHWLDDDARYHQFLDQVQAAGAPDLSAQLGFVELSLLAGWTKRKLLTGKVGRVDARRFDRFLSQA